MSNYKIRVNSEAERKQAQELFVVLGAACCSGLERNKNVNFLFMNSGFVTACSLQENFDKSKCKEITLPELRDMVVLQWNDVGDATHTDPNEKESLYFRLFGDWWNLFTGGKWQQFCHAESPRCAKLKPIEKTEMKEPKQAEFLVKTDSGYVLQVLDENAGGADVVRVPDGADTFAGDDNCHYFWQHRSGKKHLLIGCGSSLERYTQWVECEDSADEWLSNFDGDNSLRILWQREISAEEFKSKLPESTFKDFKQPEDLPFVDDKCYTNKSNGVFKLLKDKPCDISKWSELRGESLNDQYAEIEKVRQSHRTASETSNPTIKETLNQRQSQYGSFEDVATATQDLLKILEKTGLKSLPSMHKEALHMICSKMVRIVNGDHNFIESWHDIAGYATLMENELRATDGATNSRLTYQKVINGKLQDI